MPKEHVLTEIAKEATKKASLSLSKLSGDEASVEFTKIEVGKIQKVFSKIDPELIVTGVYLPISGDVKGASLLIFPKEIAYSLCDVLVKRKAETARQLTEIDKSALKEVGNIILGSLLTVFSNRLKMKMIEHLPEFSHDMFGALVDQIITQFIQKAEEVLTIELLFHFKRTTNIKGYVFLIFGTEEIKVLIKKMEKND